MYVFLPLRTLLLPYDLDEVFYMKSVKFWYHVTTSFYANLQLFVKTVDMPQLLCSFCIMESVQLNKSLTV